MLKQPLYATAFYRYMLELYSIKQINLLNSITERLKPNEYKGAPSEGQILARFLQEIELEPEIPIKDWSSPTDVAKRFTKYYKRIVNTPLVQNKGKTST